MFPADGAPLAQAPFGGHAVGEGSGAIILGHRAIDELCEHNLSMAMWCTIRTFAKHAVELGNEPMAEPIFFVKPSGCLHEDGPLPVASHPGEVHHEVECVVQLNGAMEPVAIAVGLDLTDRATQRALRADQLPWSKGKCFRSSAVVGPWSAWSGTWDSLVASEQGLHLSLSVNGEERQSTPLSEMSVTPRQQIDALLTWAPVAEGDLLFTGTPQGVGRLHPGDSLVARLTGPSGVELSKIELSCA